MRYLFPTWVLVCFLPCLPPCTFSRDSAGTTNLLPHYLHLCHSPGVFGFSQVGSPVWVLPFLCLLSPEFSMEQILRFLVFHSNSFFSAAFSFFLFPLHMLPPVTGSLLYGTSALSFCASLRLPLHTCLYSLSSFVL